MSVSNNVNKTTTVKTTAQGTTGKLYLHAGRVHTECNLYPSNYRLVAHDGLDKLTFFIKASEYSPIGDGQDYSDMDLGATKLTKKDMEVVQQAMEDRRKEWENGIDLTERDTTKDWYGQGSLYASYNIKGVKAKQTMYVAQVPLPKAKDGTSIIHQVLMLGKDFVFSSAEYKPTGETSSNLKAFMDNQAKGIV